MELEAGDCRIYMFFCAFGGLWVNRMLDKVLAISIPPNSMALLAVAMADSPEVLALGTSWLPTHWLLFCWPTSPLQLIDACQYILW